MVIWVIGMSGSGKTTVAQEMCNILQDLYPKESWQLLDGDEIRALAGNDLGHSVVDREKNGERISRMCAELSAQGKNIIACVLSIFPEHQLWNRQNIPNYKQVYIRVAYDALKKRDNKELYEKAEKGELADVVGVQIPFTEPVQSDFVLDNNQDSVHPVELAQIVLKGLGLKYKADYRYTSTDLLTTPFKYEYTKFEGTAFIQAYKANRQNALSDLKKPTNLTSWEKALDSAIEFESSPNESIETIQTKAFLIENIKKLKAKIWKDSDSKTLFKLIQRFEVSKKIYKSYSLDFKKIESGYQISDFVLFYTLLLLAKDQVSKRQVPILLNAVLKLGDILISNISQLKQLAENELPYHAISKELEVMEANFGI